MWTGLARKSRSARPAARDDPVVTVAAFVISVLALLVSGASVLYTRRQAAASSEAIKLDRARRHDEMTPQFTGEIEWLQHSHPYARLHLRLQTAQALTGLRVRLLEAPVDTQFSRGQIGVDPAAHFPIHEAVAQASDRPALAPFDRATWQLELNDPTPLLLRVQVEATIADDSWTVQVPLRVPPSPAS